MNKNVLILAAAIGLLPPLWAVLSGHVGIECGAVALICSGIYVANGNKAEDGVRITLGFLLSDAMAVAALWLMENLPFGADLNTFLTLGVLGFVAVLAVSALERFVYLPAVLCGWAIGLTVMGPLGFAGLGSMPLQVAVAMVVGVWYVGWGVDKVCQLVSGAGGHDA